MLRTRSCVSEGSRPDAASASATSAVSVIPRIWMLPREVSSIAGEAQSVAARARASSCGAVIIPPGSRTRANAPSAAGCTCNAPGQAS